MRKILMFIVTLAMAASLYATGAGEPMKGQHAKETNMPTVPFVMPWDDASAGPTDLAALNHTPAGKFGHLRVGNDGHIYAGTERIRFFGTNADGGANCPPKVDAEKMAARMAKFGFNVVRFHHLEFRKFPVGLIRKGAEKSDDFDPQAVDQMDYLFAQLREHGIYANINLLTGRMFRAADGLPAEIELLDFKERHVPAFFDPMMIELQYAYARKLLTHRNPYTKLTYAEDPAVAFVEIINEHGLLNSYFDGKVNHLPEPFARELRGQWNQWLKLRYADDATLQKAWGEDARLGQVVNLATADKERRDTQRFKDWIAFLWDTEHAYYAGMKRFLKEELGVKAMIIGSIVQNSTPNLMADLDAVDVHEYWNHPKTPAGIDNSIEWYISDNSMVNSFGKKFGWMSMFRVAGRPFTVSEWNHCAPSPYASEGPLLLAAYGCLQDWDAIYMFSWDSDKSGAFHSPFSTNAVPTVMAQSAVAAAMFRRGDVSAAKELSIVGLTMVQEKLVVARSGAQWAVANATRVGIEPRDALVHRIAIETDTKLVPATRPVNVPEADRYVSDTGQITWDQSRAGAGVVTIDSPRSKAIIGYTDGRPFKLGGFAFEVEKTELPRGWCVLSLTLLEGDSFERPRRALLVAAGKVENTGTQWERYAKIPGPDDNPNMTISGYWGNGWGHAPTRVEIVGAHITVPGAANRLTVYSLDERGQRGPEIRVESFGNNDAKFAIGQPSTTLWYELVWK